MVATSNKAELKKSSWQPYCNEMKQGVGEVEIAFDLLTCCSHESLRIYGNL